MSARINIPLMGSCPNYAHWKELVQVWTDVTEIAKEKQADALLLTLDTDGQSLALQIPAIERKSADGQGVAKILKKLDSLYEETSTQKIK